MRCWSVRRFCLLLQSTKVTNAIKNITTAATPAPIPAFAPEESSLVVLDGEVEIAGGENEVVVAAVCVMELKEG